MAKKEVFEFFFNQLVKGYKSIMGKNPEGLDLIKIKQEARQKLIDQDKVIEVQFGKPFSEEISIMDQINKSKNKIEGASNKIDEIMKEQADMYRPKTDAEIKAKFERQNKEAAERLRNKRQLTEDEYQDFLDEIGGADQLEAYNFDGTVGDAQRILKEQKEYMDDMFMEYKKGNLDPVAGDKSPARKKFLQNKYDEMEASGDKRLMTVDEIEELSSFDLGTDMDEAVKKFKEKDAKQKKTLKDFDPEDRDPSAEGGIAGFYTGGMVDVEPNLSDIGHGSDALMARTRLVAPNSQATTSTGLNYLLAEDNDNIRVPFSKGKIAKEIVDKGRRGFMKAAGAGAAGLAALKTGLLGFGKEAAPVVEKAVEAAKGVPPYFYQLIDVIKSKGQEIKSYGERIKQYIAPSKDGKSELMLTEDLNTGNIQVKKIYKEGDDMVTKTEEMNFNKGQADEGTKGTPPDDYEEVTSYNSRIYKDEFNEPDFVEGIDVKEIIKEVDVKKAEGGRIGMLAGGGILKAILKNSADAKGMTVRDFIMAMNPKSIPSNIKNLISKVDLEQLKAGYKDYYENISDMMKTRFDFQKNIEAGKTTPARELFEDMEKTMDKQSYVPKTVTKDDISKIELMLKNKFNKGRKDNANGGIQTMLGE